MDDNSWEDIYHRDGHVFTDIPPVVLEFASLLAGNGTRSILDVGCGNGRLLKYFAGLGYQVTGTEKGLPHHLFTLEEFATCFPAFDILSVEERGNVVIVLIARKY